MNNIPNISDEYSKWHKNNSLNYSLFLTASPLLSLKMLNEHPFDINELSESGVSLLAQKAIQKSYEKVDIPLSDEFFNLGWNHSNTNVTARNVSQYLLAAMLYNGADPWIEWNITGSKEAIAVSANGFFPLMCLHENTPMVELLFSHPNCPPIESLEKMLIKQVTRSEYSASKERIIHPMHSVVNAIKRDGDVKLLQILIAKGFDVNILDEKKRSPLFYAMLPSVVDLLIKNGADVHQVDNNKENVKQFWEKTISTTGKRSEMASIVTEKMKETMDITQLQEMMKPELFSQVLNSTKQMFMASYRKGKFKPNVTFNGLNLLSAALLRNDDDKNNIFISTFEGQKNQHLWDFKILGSQTVSNLELSQIFSNFGYKSPMRESLWVEKYKDTDPTDAMMETISLLLANNMELKSVLRFLQTSYALRNSHRVSYTCEYFKKNSVCAQVNVFKNKSTLETIKQFMLTSVSNPKLIDYDFHSTTNEGFFSECLNQSVRQNFCLAPFIVLFAAALLNKRNELWKSTLFARAIEQMKKEDISSKDRRVFLEHLEKINMDGLDHSFQKPLNEVSALLNKDKLMESIHDEWLASQASKKRKM